MSTTQPRIDAGGGQRTIPAQTGPPAGRLSHLGCRLLPAHHVDPAALLRFERDERDHFRRWIPDRGQAYYQLAAVEQSLRNARRWWDAGSDMLHVVVDDRNRLLARINLVDITDRAAEVGYRVARAASGRGIATAGVTDLVAVARGIGLHRLRAGTSTENDASTRVLTRCGFRPSDVRRTGVDIEGRRMDTQDWSLDLTDIRS